MAQAQVNQGSPAVLGAVPGQAGPWLTRQPEEFVDTSILQPDGNAYDGDVVCPECGEACGEDDEDEDEPWRLVGETALGINWGGWIEGGAAVNADNPPSVFNGPVTFTDREEVQLNQLWVFGERPVDTSDGGWDIGGRFDLVYGTDARFTEALGLEVRQDGTPRWNSGRFYHLALPQLYAEVGVGDLSVKIGHFFTIIGYEVVPAPQNFFYSHAYTMQYGEPFTHTGALISWKASDQWTLSGGVHYGWDLFDDVNDRVSFLGGATWTSCDERTSLAFAITAGDEADAIGGLSPRTMYSVVFSHEVTDHLTYVAQHDYGTQEDGVVGGLDSEWYGLNQYLFYTINDCWKIGLRGEWFRDDDGTRVAGLDPFNPSSAGGFVGSFYEISLGLNYTPSANLFVRPEVRWDWFDADAGFPPFPFDDGTKDNQFLFAIDGILVF